MASTFGSLRLLRIEKRHARRERVVRVWLLYENIALAELAKNVLARTGRSAGL